MKGPGPPEKGSSKSVVLPDWEDDGGGEVLPKGRLGFELGERGEDDESVLVVLELPLNGLISMSSSSLSSSSLSSSSLSSALASDNDDPLLLVLELVPGLRGPEGKMEGPSDGVSEFGLEDEGCVLEEDEDEEDEEDGELVGVPKVDDETAALGEDDVVFNGGVALI